MLSGSFIREPVQRKLFLKRRFRQQKSSSLGRQRDEDHQGRKCCSYKRNLLKQSLGNWAFSSASRGTRPPSGPPSFSPTPFLRLWCHASVPGPCPFPQSRLLCRAWTWKGRETGGFSGPEVGAWPGVRGNGEHIWHCRGRSPNATGQWSVLWAHTCVYTWVTQFSHSLYKWINNAVCFVNAYIFNLKYISILDFVVGRIIHLNPQNLWIHDLMWPKRLRMWSRLKTLR